MDISGPATLTFDDGTEYDVSVDLRFTNQGGQKSGSGQIVTNSVLEIITKPGRPILAHDALRIRVIVSRASADGTGRIVTSGGPL